VFTQGAARLEVDLIVSTASTVTLIDARSGATTASDCAHAADRLAEGGRQRAPDRDIQTRVIYGGTSRQIRGATQLVPWRAVYQLPGVDQQAASSAPPAGAKAA
jgi:hypothetical protein